MYYRIPKNCTNPYCNPQEPFECFGCSYNRVEEEDDEESDEED